MRPARSFLAARENSVAENVAKARLRIITCPFRISSTLWRNGLCGPRRVYVDQFGPSSFLSCAGLLLSKLMIVHMQAKRYAVWLDIGEYPIDWHMNDCTVTVILAIVVVRVDAIGCQLLYFSFVVMRVDALCCQLIYISFVIERTWWPRLVRLIALLVSVA